MSTTDSLALPLILPSQAQKHVTHNEAITLLDSMVHLTVTAHDVTDPPATPAAGERYIVPADATGAWQGHEDEIAVFLDGGWQFISPKVGFRAWSQAVRMLLVHTQSGWGDLFAALSRLGINATADETNRLTVAGDASLFNHDGAGHRLTLNKAAAGETASILFQSGFSGRAEFGLAGSDDFSVKTSADGETWTEALALDRTTGRARFPAGMEHAATRAPVNGLVFTPGGDGAVSIWRSEGTRSANPRTATIAGTAGDVITLDANVASRFGRWPGYMENVAYLRVWNASKVPEEPAWIIASPSASQLRVLDAAAIAGWTAGDTLRLGEPASIAPVASFAIDPAPMLQNVLGGVFRQAGLMLKCSARGAGGRAEVSASGSGLSGSFLATGSLADGSIQTGMFTVPSTVPSPVSNANLVFIAEDGALDITLASVIGVHV